MVEKNYFIGGKNYFNGGGKLNFISARKAIFHIWVECRVVMW